MWPGMDKCRGGVDVSQKDIRRCGIVVVVVVRASRLTSKLKLYGASRYGGQSRQSVVRRLFRR